MKPIIEAGKYIIIVVCVWFFMRLGFDVLCLVLIVAVDEFKDG